MKSIRLPKPDDWHCHLRDHRALELTVVHQAKQFARAIVMPNLDPPITTVHQAMQYRDRIKRIPGTEDFEPLMTLYLTNKTTKEDISAAKASPNVIAFKLYPAGATTNSKHGIDDLDELSPLLAELQRCDVPLLMHGEVTDANVDIFEREKVFIERYFEPWQQKFPDLRMVLEHITSVDAVRAIEQGREGIAATITAHHLMINRNDLLVGGIKPHFYCLPIAKTLTDQRALIAAATSGNKRFFLGTDSAPHPRENKESACGCAGIYTAHVALELYATVFEQAQALDKLADFASRFGAEFYRLATNQEMIELLREEQHVPRYYSYLDTKLIPFAAGATLSWQRLQDTP